MVPRIPIDVRVATMEDLPFIDALQKQHAKQVGWMPTKALAGKIHAYSFVATASAVVTLGAIPIFADIEPDTLCIDPMDVERKVTTRTKAIIPVHVAGRFADMGQLMSIAAKHQLQVLEDAAHAWGSLLDAKGPGTIGHCATFSFQVSKNITAGGQHIVMLPLGRGHLAPLHRDWAHFRQSAK